MNLYRIPDATPHKGEGKLQTERESWGNQVAKSCAFSGLAEAHEPTAGSSPPYSGHVDSVLQV